MSKNVDENSDNTDKNTLPDGFANIINDFVSDILITFPEYAPIIQKWWVIVRNDNNNDLVGEKTASIFKHCLRVFPERFFDILNKNVDIFSDDSDVNTEFLPGIVFKYLWKCEISDKTKDTIWNYLQLILFSIIGKVNNPNDIGDISKIFEGIDETELNKQVSETLKNMQSMFEKNQTSGESDNNIPPPNPEDIQNHLNDLMKGKLGKLAMEFAEETVHDLNIDMNNTESSKDAFQKIFKNPGNLMNIVKNVGTKLDTKIKSGEINESEIISEGMDILNKMKNMPGMNNVPGMEDIQKMFSQMGLGKNAKMNMNAMESQMKQNLKMAQMRERMKKKVETKQTTETGNRQESTGGFTDEQLVSMFSEISNVGGDKPSSKEKSSNKEKKSSKHKDNESTEKKELSEKKEKKKSSKK